jgi:4-amino-4-deoxy-L-arabinose transferase-like glycosyltransferase
MISSAAAPTLTWLEFSGGSENLVVGTVLEMRRGGPWIVPTLKGAPRTTKPPLTTWITAALVRPQTVRELSAPPQREHAYRMLAWEARWPALAASCLLIVATAWLGRILLGDIAGFVAAITIGTTGLWLRFGHSATTDVYLALWVTLANGLFAVALP